MEGPWNVMFVRMMLVKLINVSFARIMCIWFAATLKEMKATVNQFCVSLALKKFCNWLQSYIKSIFFKRVFLSECFFVCLLKLLNYRNENKYTQTFLHIQFSITFSAGSQKFFIYVIKYTYYLLSHYAVIFCLGHFRYIIQQPWEWYTYLEHSGISTMKLFGEIVNGLSS